ncbi:MAG: hypothetical protein OXR62_03095 [Ahrensia sp.]|nr:hypothetical protein [Ahrensia sp.]
MGITKPRGYEHPNKRKRRISEEETEGPAHVEAQRIPEKKKGVGKWHVKPPAVTSGAETRKCVVVRLLVYPPAKGQVAVYDEMIEAGIAPRTAILGLLKRGFGDFHAAVLKRSIKPLQFDILSDEAPIETTRRVSPEFITTAKCIFDPFGILSDRALGRTMGETIIAAADGDVRRD